jgi:7-keto-8-aminopelargonate synthetase-like enzyme
MKSVITEPVFSMDGDFTPLKDLQYCASDMML